MEEVHNLQFAASLGCDSDTDAPRWSLRNSGRRGETTNRGRYTETRNRNRQIEIYDSSPGTPTDCDQQERVRPILDELYAQIKNLQEKMAVHWRNHESRNIQSRRRPETAIADIHNKISVLDQTNLRSVGGRAKLTSCFRSIIFG